MSISSIQLIYVVAAVCFILALKGLSSPKGARSGNIIGIIGMILALSSTFLLPHLQQKIPLLIVIVSGGLVGGYIAKKIAMTDMPQLVAGFHSLVGLTAVLVAYAVVLKPENFAIGIRGMIPMGALIETSIGMVIGAITFSGSVIAFAKLQGLIASKPLKFWGQHYLSIILAILILVLGGYYVKMEWMPLLHILVLLSIIFGT